MSHFARIASAILAGVILISVTLPVCADPPANSSTTSQAAGTPAPAAVPAVKVNTDAARSFMQKGQWEAANFEWRHILEQDPGNVEATVGLAESLMKTGYQEEAISLLESVPENKRVLYSDLSLARAYTSVNEFVKAKNMYGQILIKIPFQMDAFREVEALRDRFSGIEREALDRDLTLIANKAKELGDASIKVKNYRQAVNFYEIASSHLHIVGLNNDYGLLLLLVGQYVKAHDQFTYLKTKDKLTFSEADSNASIASLSIGNLAEAKAEIQEAINESKDDKMKAKLYNNLGYFYETSKHRLDAKFAYQHAVDLDPTLTIAQLNLAYVQQADREFSDAIANYKKILVREPNRADVWNKLGFTYELQYQSKPALAAYKKALGADPKNKDALYNLAAIYKKMHKLQESNTMLKQVAEINFQAMESKGKDGQASNKTEETNKLLKYVILFPSNLDITAGLQL
jgi:tetratricopeptide (TPR) repeat protein